MDKKTEALKLAQDWYDSGNENHDDFANMIKQVIALIEQSAQQERKPWVGLMDVEIARVVSLAGFAPDWAEANIATQIVRVCQDMLKEKNA